jgi:hypothetical protein
MFLFPRKEEIDTWALAALQVVDVPASGFRNPTKEIWID